MTDSERKAILENLMKPGNATPTKRIDNEDFFQRNPPPTARIKRFIEAITAAYEEHEQIKRRMN